VRERGEETTAEKGVETGITFNEGSYKATNWGIRQQRQTDKRVMKGEETRREEIERERKGFVKTYKFV